MKVQELKHWIESLTDDIEFQYQGKWGAICPFTRQDISLCYDGKDVSVSSVDDAMKEPFINGLSLNDICDKISL